MHLSVVIIQQLHWPLGSIGMQWFSRSRHVRRDVRVDRAVARSCCLAAKLTGTVRRGRGLMRHVDWLRRCIGWLTLINFYPVLFAYNWRATASGVNNFQAPCLTTAVRYYWFYWFSPIPRLIVANRTVSSRLFIFFFFFFIIWVSLWWLNSHIGQTMIFSIWF